MVISQMREQRSTGVEDALNGCLPVSHVMTPSPPHSTVARHGWVDGWIDSAVIVYELLTAPPGGRQEHKQFVVQTGWTVCLPDLLLSEMPLSTPVTCSTYLLFSVNQHSLILTHF